LGRIGIPVHLLGYGVGVGVGRGQFVGWKLHEWKLVEWEFIGEQFVGINIRLVGRVGIDIRFVVGVGFVERFGERDGIFAVGVVVEREHRRGPLPIRGGLVVDLRQRGDGVGFDVDVGCKWVGALVGIADVELVERLVGHVWR